jgi:hypothetical protein
VEAMAAERHAAASKAHRSAREVAMVDHGRGYGPSCEQRTAAYGAGELDSNLCFVCAVGACKHAAHRHIVSTGGESPAGPTACEKDCVGLLRLASACFRLQYDGL